MSSLSDSLGSLAKSAVVMMIGSVIGRSFGLLGEVIIARQLDPKLYGEVALAYTIVMTLGNVLLLGIHEGVTRLSSSENNSKAKWEIIEAGVFTASISGFAGIFLITLFADRLAQVMAQPTLSKYLFLFLPYLVLFPLSRIVIAVLRSQGRTSAVVVTRAVVGRLAAISILALSLFVGWSAIAAIAHWMTIPLVVIILGGYLSVREAKDSVFIRPSKQKVRRLWRFSLPLAMSSVVFLFLSQLDVLMIGYFLDSSNVGNYRAVQPLQQAATIVLGSFSFLFLPLATKYYERGDLEELGNLFTIITKWSVLLTLPIVLVFTFSSNEIVQVLFGSEYQEAAGPLAILIGGLFIRTLAGPNGDIVKAIDQTRIEFYSGVVGLMVNFILNLVLIPQYGIVGAAIATVGGYVVYNIVELYAIYSEMGITPFSTNIAKPVLLSFFIVWGIETILPIESSIIKIGTLTIVSGFTAIFTFVFANSVEEEDLFLLEKVEARFGKKWRFAHRFLQLGMR